MTAFNNTLNPILEAFFAVAFGILALMSLFLLTKLIPVIKKVHLPIYRNLKPDWVHDVTGQDIVIPEQHAETDQQLRSLGMRPLGVLHVKPAFLDTAYEWVYVSESGRIYVEIVYDIFGPVFLQFMSCFPDDAMVITRYPHGENIATVDFISRFARGSIDAALHFHKEQLKEWEDLHGTPNTVQTMDDVLRYDEIFRDNYRKRDTRRIIRLSNRLLLLTLAAAAVYTFSFLYVVTGGRGMVILAAAIVGLLLFRQLLQAARYSQESHLNPPGALDDSDQPSLKRKPSDSAQ
jgi:hypothetical protein